jgi:hypothetical protein
MCWLSLIRQWKRDAIQDIRYIFSITPKTENVDFYGEGKTMIWWQPLAVWADWIVTRNRENISDVLYGISFSLSDQPQSAHF